jgi:flagellar basal-body rod protein FlgC
MRISGALSSAVSGLAANAASVQAVAENVANANTPGYRAVEVRASSAIAGGGASPGGVKFTRVRQGEVDLARQFTRLIQAEISYSANAQVVRTADNLARKLIDVVA